MHEEKLYFTQELYLEHLTTIDNVTFTRREIDIIACLLSARGTSKIASLLSVAPRTVVTHVRNIMLKLECNSRESIIDFIEKSSKLTLLRQYYAHLLINTAFEKSLKDVSKLKREHTPPSFIVYWQDPHLKTSFLHHLVNHLTLAGITAKVCEEDFNHTLRSLQNQNYTLFLLVKKETSPQEVPPLLKSDFIDTSQEESYYNCIFKILKKIYTAPHIEEISKQFKVSYEALRDPSKNPPKKFLEEQRKSFKTEIRKYSLFFFMTLCFAWGVYFYYKAQGAEGDKSLPPLEMKKEKSQITSYVPTILTKYETFIDRRETINQIHKLFFNTNIIVITGRPGVGKSCLAAEYAKEQERIVRYIDADSSEKIAQKYRELGKEFGIDLVNQSGNLVMKLVNNHLNSLPHNFLFIFDNVDNYDDIKDYVFNIPENVKVLITTRNPKLILNVTHIDLKKFQSAEAKEYLEKCLHNRKLTEEEEAIIVERVSTLPYDLKCIVAYLLENFATPTKDLLNNIGNKVDTKLFEQLAKNENKVMAWQILQYAAYLDPDFIDLDIFKSLFSKDPSLINDAIKALESLSLVSIIYDSTSHVGVRVHRELQREVKKSVQDHPQQAMTERKIVNTLLVVLDKLFPVVSHKPGVSWQEAEKIAVHVKKLLEKANPAYIDTTDVEARLYYKLGVYYSFVSIDRSQALKYALISLEKRKKHSPLHESDLADSEESVGTIYIYNNVRDVHKGIDHIKASLSLRKKIHPGNHPSLAVTLRNIGLAYLTLEEKDKELEYMKASLQMRQALYKGNHYEIAESLNDLAWCYYELGEYTQAKDFIEQSVSMFQALYPTGDPSMVYALHTLGGLLIQEKNSPRALGILHQALTIAQAFHMDNHFTTAFIFYDLGRAYLQKNDYQNALHYSLKALEIRENLNKINAKRNLMDQSLHILGDIYRLEKRKEKALASYQAAFDIQKKFSLTTHPESLDIQKKIKDLTQELTDGADSKTWIP